MECTRSNAYIGIALCSVILIYTMLRHVETGKIFQFGLFSESLRGNNNIQVRTPDDAEQIFKVIKLLEKMRLNASDPKEIVDIDSSILFLKSQLEETPSGSDYFTTNKEWNTENSNWKENFYPDSNYSGEICPEVYVRPGNRIPQWPYFIIKETCSKNATKTISNLVTVLLNLQYYFKDQLTDMAKIINGTEHLYPNITILVAIPKNCQFGNQSEKVQVFRVSESEKPGKIWNDLVSRVNTKYAFIGKDILDFEKDSNLERLVRENHPLNLNIIGSATKTFSNGHWSFGWFTETTPLSTSWGISIPHMTACIVTQYMVPS